MTLLEHEIDPVIDTEGAGEEALIKEARRLRRRRWMIGCSLAALAAVAGAAGFLVASGPPSASHHPAARVPSAPGVSPVGARALAPTRSPDLIQPAALATLPNGSLLILDSSRDQILELKPNGVLSVFAGNGRLGFSGDGGPARDAALELTGLPSVGMTVAPDGTVDVLDDGNCRIRAINPDGIIHTILRVPPVGVYPHGTTCPVTAFAVSPAGSIYLATNSEIERVSSGGRLVWVAGAHGSETYLTPSHVAFFPSALVFSRAGDLYIWNQSPKVIFRLAPTGKLAQLSGVSYAHQLTLAPSGQIFAGTQDGEVQEVTPNDVRAFYDVVPKRVAGIHWGRDHGFQEDGIAVTKTGTIYVDNAQGNGYGAGTVLVQISPTRHAALVPIHTPLAATLPRANAAGFPASLYPAARGSSGPALRSCPSDRGLEPFTTGAVVQAKKIARTYLSSRFASDIVVTDRSWWASDFNQYAAGNVGGSNTVTGEMPASNSPAAASLAHACGADLIRNSIAVTVGKSVGSYLSGAIYLLDRNGHPLVYDVH